MRTVHDRILGEIDLPGFAPRFSDFPKPLEPHAPFLGEPDDAVLTEYAGRPRAQVEALERQGVLQRGPAETAGRGLCDH
jgi:crotonobetainyl-CoA:carnitine CoA-transferase CaiB-like acyl-CoA transferase